MTSMMEREAKAGEALCLLREIIHAEAFDMPRPAYTATDAIDIANEGIKHLGLVMAEMAHLRSKVAMYERRLEIDHAYKADETGRLVSYDVPVEERSTFPDAIYCRDVEIKMLQTLIEESRKAKPEKADGETHGWTPCTLHTVAYPSLVEECIMNYDALPPSLKGWRRYRIEYGFECSCPEGLIYLPPEVDSDIIEKAFERKKT